MMLMSKPILIDQLLTIDKTGMPAAPSITQLLDKDVRLLFVRDTSKNKEMYIKEVGVIYYLGDPKGPCLQEGLSEKEALKKAIENFDLPKNYQPDILVWKLIKRYYNQKAGAGMEAVLNIKRGIHNVALAANKLNELLNDKLSDGASLEDVPTVIGYMKQINDLANQFPNTIKALNIAEENLLYEQENAVGRGGTEVISSMIEE